MQIMPGNFYSEYRLAVCNYDLSAARLVFFPSLQAANSTRVSALISRPWVAALRAR